MNLLAPFCQQGDYGFALTVQILDQDNNPLNLAGATLPQIVIGYPDGTLETVTAMLLQGGLYGQISYVVQQGDLSQFGWYQVQGTIVTAAGATLSSAVGHLDVRPNIIEATNQTFTQSVYIGNPNTNGSWQITLTPSGLSFQQLVSGVWVQKGEMVP